MSRKPISSNALQRPRDHHLVLDDEDVGGQQPLSMAHHQIKSGIGGRV